MLPFLPAATEQLPSPTLFVILYGIAWLLLLGGIVWLAGTGRRLGHDVHRLTERLEARRRSEPTSSPDKP